jgi:hypothetical protein
MAAETWLTGRRLPRRRPRRANGFVVFVAAVDLDCGTADGLQRCPEIRAIPTAVVSTGRRGDIDLRANRVKIHRGVVRVDGEFIVGPPKSDVGVRDVAIAPSLCRW